MKSYGEYADYLFSSEGQATEMVHLYDAVTTNKTDFFREPGHFTYLTEQVLPELLQRRESPLHFWSAGCSTGEEPYTLAMVLLEAQERFGSFDFTVTATDISTRVLEIARKAVYREERAEPIPLNLRRKYLLRSRDRSAQLVRIAGEVRKKIRFGRLNFMDREFGLREPMQVIFCRNVIIYFDRPTQEALMLRFCRHLVPGGFLFLGHSESLHGLDLPLVQVAPTIYRKR